MKVAINTSFSAKWNMYVNASHLFCSIVFIFVTVAALAQNYNLKIVSSHIPKELNLKKHFPEKVNDAKVVEMELEKGLQTLYEKGFFAASIDSINYKTDEAIAHLHIGEKFSKFEIDISELFIENAAYSIANKTKVNSISDWKKLQKNVLKQSSNNGFPFAALHIEIDSISKNSVNATANYVKGRFVKIDSIILQGSAKINDSFLQKYLNIKLGDAYNQDLLNAIENRMRELSYVNVMRSPAVEFYPDGAKVFLFANERKSSNFDFLLGVLPRSNQNGFRLVGQAKLELLNALRNGETLKLNYNSYTENSQELDLLFQFPFLPKLPLGAGANFNLYLNDSTFLEQNFGVNISYPFINNNNIQFHLKTKQSRLLNIEEAQIISSKALPQNVDFKYNIFGVSSKFQNLDYRFNPRRGSNLRLQLNYILKTVLKNSRILELNDPNSPNFEFESLYDDLDLKTQQINVELLAEQYFPLQAASTILLKLNAAYLGGANLFNNERYQIGGFSTLRGFDEESLIVDNYSILSLQYRYIIATNSYFSVFADAARLENKSVETNQIEYPIAFGAGMNFETSAGIFSLQYAFGKPYQQTVDFSSGKIHFGYLSLF